MMSPEQLSDYANALLRVLIDYSPKLISAILILFVGLYAIRLINRSSEK